MVSYFDDLFLRTSLSLIVLIVSYVFLNRTKFFNNISSFFISLSISLLIFYFSREETLEKLGSMVYQPFGFLILNAIVFLIVFWIIFSFPYSATRRYLWAIYGAVLIILLFQKDVSLPTYYLFIYIALILFMIIFDKVIRNYIVVRKARRLGRI